MSEEQRLYTTPQAAQELGVSASLLRMMIMRGTAHPKQKIGNSWVFTIDEIERLRQRNRKSGPAKGTRGRECEYTVLDLKEMAMQPRNP